MATPSDTNGEHDTAHAPELILPDEKMISDWVDTFQNFIDNHILTVDTLVQVAVIAAAFLIGAAFQKAARTAKAFPFSDKPPAWLGHNIILRLQTLSRALVALGILFGTAVLHRILGLETHFYLVEAAIGLTAASIIIRMAVLIISNPVVQTITAWVVWTITALAILGALEDVSQMLSNVAISMGTFHLTALTFVKSCLATLLLVYSALALSHLIERRLNSMTRMASGSRLLIIKIIRMLLVILAILIGVSMAGVNLSVLAVFSGAVGLGIGLGLQRGIANLFTGMMLLMDHTIQPGDIIEMEDGTFGKIRHMSSRCVEVNAFNGKSYLIPNENLVTKPVINWSRNASGVAQSVSFGVSYKHAPKMVIDIAVEAISGIDRIVKYPKPSCILKGFGDSSLDFELGFRLKDPENGIGNVKSSILLALWDAFEQNGIEIPYPRRDLYVYDEGKDQI